MALSETQKGGRYLVGGQLVDAEGKPLKGTAAAKREAETDAARQADEIPEDFPGRESLVAGGFPTLSSIRAASDEDLDAVSGIGPATVKEIRAAQKE